MCARNAGRVTVRGLVMPSEWDDQDEVCAVTICSDDEDRFEVVDRKMVRALLKHMDKQIEAVGSLAEDKYGDDAFQVVSFEVIDDDEDYDDEDDDDEDDDDEDDDYDEDDDDEDDDYDDNDR